MSNKIIRAALEAKLNTWAKAQVPPIPIAWQNATFTPPTQARYLRAFLLSGETQDPAVSCDIHVYIGIFQVSICIPEGSGATGAESVVDSLIAEFPQGLIVPKPGMNVMILKTPYAAPAMNEPGLYVVPVSIRYRAT